MNLLNTKKLSISLIAISFTMCFCFWLSGAYPTLTSAQTTACSTCGAGNAGDSDYLIFALQTDNQSGAEGKNVEVPGNENEFDGRVHSNGDFYVGGNQNTFTSAVTYEDQFFSQPSNTYPAGFPAQAAAQGSFPGFLAGYTPPACMHGTSLTGTNDITINNSSPDGVYCNGPDKTIKISDPNVTGSFTFISNGGFIDISGNSQTLTPFANNVLAYSTRASLTDDVIKFQGNNSNVTGIFFAPNGQVFISGNENIFCTQFVGQRVEVSGNENIYRVLGTLGCTVVTAATATVSGRAMDANGRALSKVKVFITDSNGVARQAVTNPFGYYRFEDLPSGETYIIQGFHKRYSFAPVVVSLAEDLSAPNLIAEQYDLGLYSK